MHINEKLILLAMLKKKEDESLKDVVLTLENTGVFSLKDGKQHLKNLKKEEYFIDSFLSLKGELKAKEVELEFKL